MSFPELLGTKMGMASYINIVLLSLMAVTCSIREAPSDVQA